MGVLEGLQPGRQGARMSTRTTERVAMKCATCNADAVRLETFRAVDVPPCASCGGTLVEVQELAGDDETIAVGPVYMAGPISASPGRTVAQNVAQAVAALDYLTRRRVAVVCPQLTALSRELDGVPYEDWMSVDFLLLDTCGVVLALPFWETSSGTRRELLFAAERNIPVFYRVEHLLEHLGVSARAARPFGAPPRA